MNNPLKYFGPGLLVAATGVGAGDLATSAFAGHQLGLALLWAVVLGAIFKFVLNEGLARWQIARGTTFIEGAFQSFGMLSRCLFLFYLVVWSYFVGSALISACGLAGQALLPFENAANGKIFYGIAHSIIGCVLVWFGGFRLFEKTMKISIVIMFFSVLSTAVLVLDDMSSLEGFFKGLLIPTIPVNTPGAIAWTVALIGGVGGTVTILCYAYWLQDSFQPEQLSLPVIRKDLVIAYGLTALFGLSMVVIGDNIKLFGKGAQLIVQLADSIGEQQGELFKTLFLIGAWGALFSSLLGVWQSIPYLFCDVIKREGSVITSKVVTDIRYRGYLVFLTVVPVLGLFYSFKSVQMWYSIAGALFLPVLAIALLVLNNSSKMREKKMANTLASNLVLLTILLFFLLAFYLHIRKLAGF